MPDIFEVSRELHSLGIYTWASKIKKLLDNCGLSYAWSPGQVCKAKTFISNAKKVICDQYVQTWGTDISTYKITHGVQLHNSNKLRTYCKIKNIFGLERYLLVNNANVPCLTKFRISAHNFMIERGRYEKTPLHNRTCKECYSIEDEVHIILNCKKYRTARKKLFSTVLKFRPSFEHISSIDKFLYLMTTDNSAIIVELCNYLKGCFEINDNSQGTAL